MPETILEAYCVELDEIMTIDDVREAYFAQVEPRKRFNFLCSDEVCRSMSYPPHVTGVAYATEDSDISPHFRRNPKHEHAESCIWGVYNATLEKILKNKAKYKGTSDKNLFLDFEKIDSETVFDEFYIRKEKPAGVSKDTAHKMRCMTMSDIERHIIHEHKKTSSLASVVDMFRSLTDEQKCLAKIKLPNTKKLIYDQAFKPVQHIKKWFTWTHIYYGTAKIYKYTKNKQGYGIFFQRACCEYNDDGKIYDVTAFIPFDDFTRKARSNQQAFEHFAESKSPCCCYILSNATHLQNNDRGGGLSMDSVVIESASPVVLREISPKCR